MVCDMFLGSRFKRIREELEKATPYQVLLFKAVILTVIGEIALIIVAAFFRYLLEAAMAILISIMIVNIAINSFVLSVHEAELSQKRRMGEGK